jgi:ABC-2 type transport system permease protein
MNRALAQAGWETRLLLRNGEQVLLTLVIPVGLLLALTVTPLTQQSPAQALATVVTVSVIAACFTSLAIATAFERRSGALRFLRTTPLGRGELLAGKAMATAVTTLVSVVLVSVVAFAVGWRPTPGAAWAVPAVLLGMACFAAWGFALAGLLRAEAVLAVANGLFLVLIVFGGVVVPASSLPDVVQVLPSAALADALASALLDGQAAPPGAWIVLAAWAVIGALIGSRTFRWT